MLTWGVLAACLVAAVGLAGLLGWGLRRYGIRVEHGPGDRAEQVHRLRRVNVLGSLAAVLLGLALAAAPWAYVLSTADSPDRPGAPVLAAAGVVSLVAYVLPLVASYRGIRPVYARVRGIPRRGQNVGRGLAVGVTLGLVFPALWVVALLVAPPDGPWRLVAWVLAFLVSLVLVKGLLVPVWLFALRAHPLPPDRDEHLSALADRLGVRLRDIRAFAGRQEKVANAVQVGTLPRLRYILVSDYLLESLTEPQVDAVVAHELAHIRGHHALIKIGSLVGVLTMTVALAALAATLVAGTTGSVVILALLVGFFLARYLTRGLLGIRLERRADLVAAREVGVTPMIEALERLAELNDMRRRTGTAWAILTQHPGLDQRTQTLRELGRVRDDDGVGSRHKDLMKPSHG